MAKKIHDYIIIGSGCAGAQAALTLIEHGQQVLMLDAGIRGKDYSTLIPNLDFLTIRKEDPLQHRYLLGESFEGIPTGTLQAGAQLTPPRQFVTAGTDGWLPVQSDSFHPMESLSLGGLGNAWGTGSFVFSDPELIAAGLNPDTFREAYATIARRIGISGQTKHPENLGLGSLRDAQPPAHLDANARLILARYQRKQQYMNQKGFFLERTPLALLTKDLQGRQGTTYREMEFWDDHGQSAYRPWITIDQLKRRPGFQYMGDRFVLRFEASQQGVMVHGISMSDHLPFSLHCRKLIIGASSLGTARIVLRSFNRYHHRIPLICNPYCYLPTLQWAGRKISGLEFRSGLSQLSLYFDPAHTQKEVSIANLYTYRSLLLFRLIREMPLNYRLGRQLAQYLQRMLVIAGIHHPESPGPEKHIRLIPDATSRTGDKLEITYRLSDQEKARNQQRERQFIRALRNLGCLPMKKIYPGPGSSVHYAGTLPFDNSPDPPPLTINSTGKLSHTAHVYIADGSGFRFLPGKGLTLTLMAQAHYVAQQTLTSAE